MKRTNILPHENYSLYGIEHHPKINFLAHNRFLTILSCMNLKYGKGSSYKTFAPMNKNYRILIRNFLCRQKTSREYSSGSQHHHIGNLTNGDRGSSGSSIGSASHRRTPLNAHGMVMSKFCYECGLKFPVPQAKFCSECGTQRI